MSNALSLSNLGEWLSRAFAKPVPTKSSEQRTSIDRGNEINSKLVHTLSLGSEPAFRSIYDYYAPAIYRVSLRYFQSRQLAEELVSEAFTALWHKRDKFSEPEDVRLFLFTTSKNIAVKYLTRMAESDA